MYAASHIGLSGLMSICFALSTMRSTCRARRSRSEGATDGDEFSGIGSIDLARVVSDSGDDQPLDLRSRDPADRANLAFSFLKNGLRDIVTVTNALFVGMARAHSISAIVMEETYQERWRLRSECSVRDGLLLESFLHSLEQRPIDNRRMLRWVNLAAIGDLADVKIGRAHV